MQVLANYRTMSYDMEAQYLFINYLQSELNLYGFDTYVDLYGNLIGVRGAGLLPLLIHHVDINQVDANVPILVKNDTYCLGIHKGQQIGVGFDDKAGILFALWIAEQTDLQCKIVFTLDEEVGCVGTQNLDVSIFDNITLAIQLDRRGYKDISSYTNGVYTVSKEFILLSKDLCNNYGFKFIQTMYTDVGELKAYHNVDFCCMNISTGYYNAHQDNEYLNIAQFNNSCKFAYELLKTFGNVKQVHKYVKPKIKSFKYTSPKQNHTGKKYWDEFYED